MNWDTYFLIIRKFVILGIIIKDKIGTNKVRQNRQDNEFDTQVEAWNSGLANISEY